MANCGVFRILILTLKTMAFVYKQTENKHPVEYVSERAVPVIKKLSTPRMRADKLHYLISVLLVEYYDYSKKKDRNLIKVCLFLCTK